MNFEFFKTKKGKRAKSALAALLISAVSIGGTYAYRISGETATNTTTIGDVSITLTEPDYPGNNSDEVKKLQPHQEVPKNPQITNTGTNDAIVFLKITVPVVTDTTVDAGRQKETHDANSKYEPVYLKDDSVPTETHATQFDNGWFELTSLEEGTDHKGTTRTYVLGYKTKLAKNAKTTAAFDKIQLAKLLETASARDKYNIKVEGYAIQADEVIGADGRDVTDTLNIDNLTYIYNAYVNQQKTN